MSLLDMPSFLGADFLLHACFKLWLRNAYLLEGADQRVLWKVLEVSYCSEDCGEDSGKLIGNFKVVRECHVVRDEGGRLACGWVRVLKVVDCFPVFRARLVEAFEVAEFRFQI